MTNDAAEAGFLADGGRYREVGNRLLARRLMLGVTARGFPRPGERALEEDQHGKKK